MHVEHLSRLLNEALRTGAAPGAAIAVSIDGRRLEHAAGAANWSSGSAMSTQSRFQMGCITKLLTSLVTLELENSSRLDLDQPIGCWLPEVRSTSAGQTITPRHLLSHTSGYQGLNIADPAVRYYYGWPKFLALLGAGRQLFPAGRVFNYEHTECVLLGEIAQRLTGRSLRELFGAMIFDPLGIHCGDLRSDMSNPRCGVMDHACNGEPGQFTPLRAVPYCSFWDASLSDLTMSLADLVTLGEAVAGFRHGVFSTRTIETIRRAYVELPSSFGGKHHERMPIAFGCGCAQYDDSVFGHNGSARGQTCALRFDVSTRAVLAVGLNCWQPHARDLLCTKVITALRGGRTASAARPDPAQWSFAELTGRYVGALGSCIEVSATDSGLSCAIIGTPPQPTARVLVLRAGSGELQVSSEVPHLTMGFFRPPASSTPGLMVGLNAYCREQALPA